MKIFYLPDLGEGLTEAEVHQWHVQAGDEVAVDQLLVTVETAKALVDIPSPYSGQIIKLYGSAGTIIQTGEPLAEFAMEEKFSADQGSVVGNLQTGNVIITETAQGITPQHKTHTALKILPAVRALAKELSVDLDTVTATGPNGLITTADIKQAHSKKNQATQLKIDFSPLQGIRRAMAHTMTESHKQVVPVTIFDDADIHLWPQDTDITIRIIRALIQACKAEPALNAWYDGGTTSRRLLTDIHLGLALDTQEGLLVPVIQHVDQKSAIELRRIIDTFKQQALKREIPPDILKGASIALSNFGNFAGRYATPIVVPPAVAILGTGRTREELVIIDNTPSMHKKLPLSLSFDHRAITGGEATRFLAAIITDLQKPD